MTDTAIKIDAAPSAAGAKSGDGGRLLSLDVFRGITILAMILVNNAGSRERQFSQLAHAEWHGWTLTDLVFPFFLFIMGAAMAFSFRRYRTTGRADAAVYRKIVQRTAILVLLGLFLNVSKGALGWLLGYEESIPWNTLRYTGVLQRIALVYLTASILVLNVGIRTQGAVALTILVGYWALVAWLPNPHDYRANLSPEGNVGRMVDLAVIGAAHLRDQGRGEPTDPTGILGTFTATVSALMGYWAGLLVLAEGPSRRTMFWLLAAGVVGILVGLTWDTALPINKKLWTSSYTVWSGGLACIGLAACLEVFDIRNFTRLARPFAIVGTNAITAYVGAELLSVVLGTVRVGSTTVKSWLYNEFFAAGFADPRIASVAYAAGVVVVWWIVLAAIAKQGWTLRV